MILLHVRSAATLLWCIGVLFLLLATVLIPAASAQDFNNLDFRESCESSKTGLCSWDLSWGGKGAVTPDSVDGGPSIRIRGEKENSVGFTEQTALLTPGTTRIIRVSASIRSSDLVGKGAGINVGLYDEKDRLIATRDMGGFYSLDWVRGTTEWKSYTVSLVVPAETRKIKIGAIAYGKGEAFFRNYKVEVSPVEGRVPSKLARSYVGSVIDIIRKHSLYGAKADLRQMEQTALKIAGPAKTYEESYLAVEYLLESLRPLGDNHSFLMKPAEVKNWETAGSQVSKVAAPEYSKIEEYGYLLVPAFHSGNQQSILEFAGQIQAAIRRLSDEGVRGWIVDLRQNTGGNMAPMIAGLGPLFSTERLGALIDVRQKPNAWHYKDGRYYWDGDKGWQVPNHVELKTRLPIAVLVSDKTGSSGEAVAVSFLGNAQTRLFGTPTWGLTTGNGDHTLKDGARIFLASTVMSDRTGRVYKGRITPDEVVGDPDPTRTLAAAVAWLKAQQP